MPSEFSSVPSMSEFGSLLVRVSTAGVALPVEGADVHIDGSEEGNRNVHYLLTTDRSGLLERILLPTPPASLTLQPSNIKDLPIMISACSKTAFIPFFSEMFRFFPA